jgi:glycosyltransferase involved in cell wall biosynthesis
LKVVFLFGGLPHYFNKVLNKINADPNIEVVVIAPLGNGVTLGSGVNQTEEGIDFRLVRLLEYQTWYGKPFFRNFYRTIQHEKPDAIVCGWPYFLSFLFNPLLLWRMKNVGIQLISKEIPFTVPAWHESFEAFGRRCVDSQKDELIFKNRLAFFLLKLVRKYLYTIVFNKAFLYIESGRDIIRSYGLGSDKITVTYNSPDTDEIMATIALVKSQNPGLKQQKHRILHIGRLVRWKNVHLLIEAVSRLTERYPDIELAVIGRGEEENNLKQLVSDLKLEKHVRFLGALYEGVEQTTELLKSEVYVLAGMGGLSINEAMVHRLPVICSVADGTERHLVFEGRNGLYFKDNNLESLVGCIDKIFQMDIGAMGLESFKIIESSININAVATKYIGGLLQK